MYKAILTYEDYNGEKVKEARYFNLEESDIMRLMVSKNGNFINYLQRLLVTNQQTEVYQIFEDLIAMSYGVKSDDGKLFIRNQKVLEDFKSSRAYSTFIMSLITEDGVADAFINGIMPPAYIQQISNKVGGFKNVKDQAELFDAIEESNKEV